MKLKNTSVFGAVALSLTAVFATTAFAVDFAEIATREHLSEPQQRTLKANGAVVKSLTRNAANSRVGHYTDTPASQPLIAGMRAEVLRPIFRELTVYRLTNGTPAQVAGIFTSYGQYGTLFHNVNIISANAFRTDRSNGLTMDTRFEIGIVFEPVINLTVVYNLRNVWAAYNSAGGSASPDSYRVTWSIIDSPEGVHFVEGVAEFTPVTVDGTTKTLIKYYNYINPVDDRSEVVGLARSVRNTGFIAALDNNTARDKNRNDLVTTVNTIADEAQRASGINTGTVCQSLPIASCAAH